MSKSQTQDARAVAYRALCLGAVLKRSEYEMAVQSANQPDRSPSDQRQIINKHHILNSHLLKWIEKENLVQYLSENELALLLKPLGRWNERHITHTGWRVESLGMMLWALGRIETIPPFDVQFELHQVIAPLDLFTPTIDMIWCADLRPVDALEQQRDIAELWNWRSRAQELERMGVKPPKGVSFSEIIRATAEKAHHLGGVSQIISDDFPAFGKAYVDLSPAEYALVSAIAYERYFALNWLCELTAQWEQVTVDI